MQIIAGTPSNSAHTNTFHYAFVKGKLYLAVGVNNSVIIYSHNLTTVQVILESQFSSVSCISWQQETGKLAVCFESSTIYIYSPTFKKEVNEERIQWNKIQEIDNALKTINCICWKPVIAGNCLLAAGSSIVLWELTEQKDEETNIITHGYKEEFKSDGNIVAVKYCSYSADGKYIITMGEYDRFIKVWYFNQHISRYTFVYLSHSKSVVTATWKRKKEGEPSNILLTVCRNNIVRLWSESSVNERLQFSVCCVIEPGPGTVVDWLNEPNYHFNTTTSTSTSSNTTATTTTTNNNLSVSRYSSLVPSAGNSLDWLVSIQKNGMVIIWKVKGLSDVPKHTPNFSIWSRFSVQSNQSMSSHLRLIGLASTFSNDSRICPVKFHMYVLSSSGAINCWECIEEGSINPRINSTLVNCNIGHKGVILHTIPHNKFPYVASIDQSQRCILWKTEPNMLIDLPFLLNYVATFDNTLLFAWTPSKNIVLTSNNRGVFVYETDLMLNENKNQNKGANSPTATLMGLLADSDQFCPLIFLEVLLPNVQSSEDHQWQIIGIPENGEQICLWTMKAVSGSTINNGVGGGVVVGGSSSSAEGHKSPKQTMSFQIGQFITSFKTPSKILCVCTGSHLLYSSSINKVSLITYSVDNTIRLWKITDNNEIELITTFSIETSSPIHELHLSQHGYLAATTTTGAIYVYYLDTSSNSKLIAREYITLNNNNNNNNSKVYSKWLNLLDGTSVLETIQDKTVSLYNSKQSTKTFRSYQIDWKKKDYYNTLLPGQCSTWLTDGTHICGASNQIYINTKWSTEKNSSTLLHNYSNQALPYPHYHPKILFEYLLSGNFKAVDYILKKLVNELTEISTSSNTNNAVKKVYQLSLEQVPVQSKKVTSNASNSTTKTSNSNNNNSSSIFSSQDQYDFLSSTTASSLSSLLTSSSISESIESEISTNKSEEEQAFTVSDAKLLSEYLTSISLPNVSGSEQMYLLAIIDTFSQMQSTKGGIDESGVRYLLAYKIYSFLRRSLPPADRPTSLSSADFCWALHSEAEEALLQICFPSDGTWSTARSLGIGYWLRKPTILKNFIERLAKTQFSINKDPHDCALFYLALNKKPALVALFKAVKNTAVHDFMKNDFTIDKWKTAALKNAYVLLGKQKFELAAAFFLLGGQLKDAVDICIKKLADYQLALVIARLQEGEPGPVFDYIVNTHLLPLSLQAGDYTWASLLYWLIKKYTDSITVLLCKSSVTSTDDNIKTVDDKLIPDPANQYLFQFLRGHTMLRDSTINFEDINLQLLKQTSLLYRETGYSLLVPSQIKEMLQIIENRKSNITNNNTSSSSSSSISGNRGGGGFGYRPFRMAFLDEPAPEPKKETVETIDSALPLSIALQLLCQQIIGQIQMPTGEQSLLTPSTKPLLKENFDFLTSYLQINPTCLLSNLLSFCEHRFYVRSSFDLLWEENSHATRISLLLTYCQMIYNLLSHSSEFSTMTEEQLNHLYSLSSQILECYEQIKTYLNPTENLYITVSIQVGILIYTWMNQYYSTLAHILHMKDIKSMLAKVEEDRLHALDLSRQVEMDEQISTTTTTTTTTTNKTIAYGEVAIEYDEATIKYIDEILLLLVVKKYLNVIEGELQQTAGKAVEYFGYLNIWLYHIKQDTTDVPESFYNYIKSLKITKDSTMLSIFYEAAKKSKKYKTNINYKILWDYLAKEDLNSIFSEINFTIDIEHKASSLNEEAHHEDTVFKCMDVVSLYKDKDILQSFCVNNLDNLQIAVATTRGIKEISLSKGNLFELYEESESIESSGGVDLPKDDSVKQDTGLSNFLHKSVDKGKKLVTHSISKQIEYPVVSQWLESHPLHPYYLSGGIDGSLCLWQFNAQKENALMVTYKSSSNPRINKIHFNSRGTKFGSCDMSGKLSLWRFDANEASLRPFQVFTCHTKRTLDFTFLNSGSVVASAGINYDKKNIAIWDTLKPPERSCVISFTAHEAGGASSIVYSARHQILITGGKKGDIEIFDLRQQKLLTSIKAHSMNVKSLAIDPEQQFILTGSSEGNAKLWDLPTVTQKECWEDIHMKHTFVRKPGVFSAPVSTFGVMQVLADKEYFYSCGSDGALKRIQYTRTL